MDNNENRTELQGQDQGRQIQLVMNRPETDETTIDLGNVFHNMKVRSRLFAWVLVLCLVVGVCAPLLLYQISSPMLTVSSVVTLRYTNPLTGLPVTELIAPDGTELDVNQVTSAYVLQKALEGITLSQPITVALLRNNITVRTVLTEESQRTKEALAGLADAKNADAYKQLQTAEIHYQNRFLVTLKNGFKPDEQSRTQVELKDSELKLLLDRVLTAYNDYLVFTYADVRLPEDYFSIIEVEDQDVLDVLDQIRAGIQNLYNYCDEKADDTKAYRSWKTGLSLEDWMETLTTFRSINVDYLYAMVSENAITRDKDALLTNWKYQLRVNQNKLEEVNESIAETEKLLASYKNDEVFISMQESDAAKTTKTSTRYYNGLILEQNKYYDQVANLEASIADYEQRIKRLEDKSRTDVTAEIEEELARSMSSVQEIYSNIRAHMEELFVSPLYTTYEDFSAAQGKSQSFLEASLKKMIIGAAAGLVIGCGLWFLAGLAPEFSRNRKEEENGKEAAAV